MSNNAQKGGWGAGSGQAAPNLGQLSSQAYQGALAATGANQMLPPGQIATTDLQPYMNPFQDQVVGRTMQELNRQRDIALRGVSDAATAANAFGGSRHGIAEAELGRAYADKQADTLANLYYGGFDTANRLAQQDIANLRAGQVGNLAAANQLANLSNMGFGRAQEIQQGLAGAGRQQQALQQAIMNAAIGHWAGMTGQPQQTLDFLQSGLAGYQVPTSTTTEKEGGGLMDYLNLAGQIAGMGLTASPNTVLGSWLT